MGDNGSCSSCSGGVGGDSAPESDGGGTRDSAMSADGMWPRREITLDGPIFANRSDASSVSIGAADYDGGHYEIAPVTVREIGPQAEYNDYGPDDGSLNSYPPISDVIDAAARVPRYDPDAPAPRNGQWHSMPPLEFPRQIVTFMPIEDNRPGRHVFMGDEELSFGPSGFDSATVEVEEPAHNDRPITGPGRHRQPQDGSPGSQTPYEGSVPPGDPGKKPKCECDRVTLAPDRFDINFKDLGEESDKKRFIEFVDRKKHVVTIEVFLKGDLPANAMVRVEVESTRIDTMALWKSGKPWDIAEPEKLVQCPLVIPVQFKMSLDSEWAYHAHLAARKRLDGKYTDRSYVKVYVNGELCRRFEVFVTVESCSNAMLEFDLIQQLGGLTLVPSHHGNESDLSVREDKKADDAQLRAARIRSEDYQVPCGEITVSGEVSFVFKTERQAPDCCCVYPVSATLKTNVSGNIRPWASGKVSEAVSDAISQMRGDLMQQASIWFSREKGPHWIKCNVRGGACPPNPDLSFTPEPVSKTLMCGVDLLPKPEGWKRESVKARKDAATAAKIFREELGLQGLDQEQTLTCVGDFLETLDFAGVVVGRTVEGCLTVLGTPSFREALCECFFRGLDATGELSLGCQMVVAADVERLCKRLFVE